MDILNMTCGRRTAKQDNKKNLADLPPASRFTKRTASSQLGGEQADFQKKAPEASRGPYLIKV